MMFQHNIGHNKLWHIYTQPWYNWTWDYQQIFLEFSNGTRAFYPSLNIILWPYLACVAFCVLKGYFRTCHTGPNSNQSPSYPVGTSNSISRDKHTQSTQLTTCFPGMVSKHSENINFIHYWMIFYSKIQIKYSCYVSQCNVILH